MNAFVPARSEEELYVDTDFKIVYEDAFFLIADKPAPLPIHRVGAFRNRNLLSLLNQKSSYEFLAPVNRLDSETSGLVVFAKTSEAAGKLGTQFENRTVEKDYLGIVFGKPQPQKGSYDDSLGFDESLGYRRRVLEVGGETAHTNYETLESRGDYSLMKISPRTGRTHQIRIHFALAGHPLVGDKIYIQEDLFLQYVRGSWQEWMRDIVKLPRLALHASGLKIRHPETHQELTFHSELPVSLKSFWDNQKT